MNRAFFLVVLVVFAGLPLVAALAPRALCFWPSLAGLFLAAGFFVRERKIATPPLAFTGLLAFSLLFAAAGTFWAVEPGMAFEKPLEALAILLPGVMGFTALRALHENDRNDITSKIQAVLFPAALVACALLVVEIYGGMPIKKFLQPILETKKPRLSNLNRGVTSLLLILLPLAALLFSKHRARSLVLLGGALALVAGTQSQSAQIAVLTGVIFYFLFPVNRLLAFRVLAIMIAVLMMAAPFIAPPLFKKAVTLAESNYFLAEKAYAPPRLEIWDFVARRSLEKPFLGHGVEATRAITDFDTAQLYHKSPGVLHPHNFALQLWIEMGISGVLLGAVLLFLLLEGIARLPAVNARRLAMGLFAGCLCIASFGYGLWQGWWIGAIVMVLLLSALDPAPQEKDRRSG